MWTFNSPLLWCQMRQDTCAGVITVQRACRFLSRDLSKRDKKRGRDRCRDACLTQSSALKCLDSPGQNQSGGVPAGNRANARLQMMINAVNLSAAKTTARHRDTLGRRGT